MGIEDRDYYQKDRKKVREQKFNKKDIYYHPKEFRRDSNPTVGRPLNDWSEHEKIRRQRWAVLIAFVVGGFVTFWVVMIILRINANLLWLPFDLTKKALAAIGVL